MSENLKSRPASKGGTACVLPGWTAWVAGCLALAFAVAAVMALPIGGGSRSLADRLFALDTAENTTWFITRASGVVAYLLLWLSTAWGLAIPSRIVDRLLHRTFTFDFHQVLSLLSLAFLGLHVFILTADRFLPFSLAQIFVPFLSNYRPIWVGIGVISLYVSVLVTGTFYVRQWISMRAFRLIHYLSLIGYVGATLHAIFSGTDSSLPAALVMYLGTFLVILFLTVYWLFSVWQGERGQLAPSASKAA